LYHVAPPTYEEAVIGPDFEPEEAPPKYSDDDQNMDENKSGRDNNSSSLESNHFIPKYVTYKSCL